MTEDYTQPDHLKNVPTQTTGSELGLRCAVASGSAFREERIGYALKSINESLHAKFRALAAQMPEASVFWHEDEARLEGDGFAIIFTSWPNERGET